MGRLLSLLTFLNMNLTSSAADRLSTDEFTLWHDKPMPTMQLSREKIVGNKIKLGTDCFAFCY